jgi:hypothetical protein
MSNILTQTKNFFNKIAFLDGFQLKVFMLFLMTLDHLYRYFEPAHTLFFFFIGECPSRVVAPVFAFLIAEGLSYTRDRNAYLVRLFAFGAATVAGNHILALIFDSFVMTNNIILTFAFAAGGIVFAERFLEDKTRPEYGLFSAFCFVMTIPFEWSYLAIPAVALPYLLRRDKLVAALAQSAFFFAVYFNEYLKNAVTYKSLFIGLASIPLLLYTGERGYNKPWAKYLFYWYYPVHLWVIYILNAVLYG